MRAKILTSLLIIALASALAGGATLLYSLTVKQLRTTSFLPGTWILG